MTISDLALVASRILGESWELLVDAAPFLLFGFLLAGIIKSFVPFDAVRRHLGAKGFGAVVKAALIGVPLPLCSCSVIPTALALRKQGAHKAAVASFLVSTPETGVDSVAVSYALLDPLMTLFRPVAAFVAALVAGGLELWLGGENPSPFVPVPVARGESCDDGRCGCETPPPVDATPLGRLADGVRYAFVDLVDDLAGWMVAGLLLAGAMVVILPDGLFDGSGSDWLMMPLMLVAGIPLYVCATSSTPLAAALILKGVSPGAALVFLLAGPATNLGTLMALRAALGGRSTLLYLTAISASAIGMGLLLNLAYGALALDPIATLGVAGELFPPWFSRASAIAFMALAVAAWARRMRKRRPR